MSSRAASTGKFVLVVDKRAVKITKTTTGKVLTVESMNPQIRNAEYAVRGALPIRAEALSKVRLGNARKV